MYNVLVIGSGGREHVFAWKLNKDPKVSKVFCAPGNGGTESVATNVAIDISNHESVLQFVKENNIDLTLVGPEAPLSAGIVDYFTQNGHLIFGPTQYAAQLETSKAFARDLMEETNVPQPAYFTCSDIDGVISVKAQIGLPLVLKADGLAAGKGVIICKDDVQFEDALDLIFKEKKFGDASKTVLVEECLYGEELSVFAVCDGNTYSIIGTAQDHKRIYDNDRGPNTGGMGAYSPTKIENDMLMQTIREKVIEPVLDAMSGRNHPYKGFLYAGLMMSSSKPYVIEFNARMGDPETQVVVPRIRSSFFDLIWLAANGKLDEYQLELDDETAVTVVLAADGYPDRYESGNKITGLDSLDDGLVFHAGTRKENNDFYTSGGRVLNVIGKGESIDTAIAHAYSNVSQIDFTGKYNRKDIGHRAKSKQEISNED